MAENNTTPQPRWLWYGISFIVPPVGIILGIIYRRKETPESLDFGKKTILAAVAGIAAYCALYAVFFFVLGAAEWL